jgi:hypothetical protein
MFLLRDNLINNLIYLGKVLDFLVTIRVFLFCLFVTSYGSHGGPYSWLNNFGWRVLKDGVYGLLRFVPGPQQFKAGN